MYTETIKPLADRLFAFLLLFVFASVILIIGFLLYVKMGKPLLFRQKRPGLHGKLFEILKFRTMQNTCDSEGNLLSDEARLHGLGKTIRNLSLDELPQLLNVLRGEMSFVGPRPLLEDYLPLYNSEQSKRHDVKPGITGWAQVNGRNAISWEQKFAYDLWYVEHQSLMLDMKILWMTFVRVLKRNGINSQTSVGMEPFKGTK
jgi:lipopolysaccharide/colanic/teichoic acid biosynthesis glycosyltransferase